MTAIKLVSGSVLSVTASRTRTDNRLAIPISFIAGFLIGVPITYCLLFLAPHDGNFYGGDETQRPNSFGRFPFGNSSRNDFLDATQRSDSSGRTFENSTQVPPLVTSLLVRTKERPVTSGEWAANGSAPALEDMVDGVFWTSLSEKQVPRGYGDRDVRLWKRFLNNSAVLGVEEGCGRMQNRMVMLAEGRRACCRYRHNDDQIQGEIFSFHLGRLLGLRNLPPSALALADSRLRRWAPAAAQMTLARWSPERPVVLTQFVEGLQPAFVPRHFRQSGRRRLHPVPDDLTPLGPDKVGELVQWSDLVLFDYLTGNLDRVVNNLFNERWNADMMRQPTHNLARTPQGLLLFLDNESGLLHGYRLLDKYEHFHRALLDGLCVFRRGTVQALDRLHRGNVGALLRQAFEEGDPGMSDWLPFLPEKSLRTLRERIAHVHHHVRTCQSRFGPKSAVLEAPDTV